jgi:hypothetical protein
MSASLADSIRGGKLSVLWLLWSGLAKTRDIYGEMKVHYDHNMYKPEESRGLGWRIRRKEMSADVRSGDHPSECIGYINPTTGCETAEWGLNSKQGKENFFLSVSSRKDIVAQAPTQRALGTISPRIYQSVKPTTSFQLVPRLTVDGAIPTLPPTSLWQAALAHR